MNSINIQHRPNSEQFAQYRAGFGQRFLVTVDTEEDFVWDSPKARTGHRLASVKRIAEFQTFCEAHGVVPLYLIDYPIATCSDAISILKPASQAGRAEIGLHLHPWVNPPFDEELSQQNSYAGNLSEEHERAKFIALRDVIADNFGVQPRIYRAGRYGAGPNTASILQQSGFTIDSSVRAHFDYRADGGPDYRDHPIRPYWLDGDKKLLELPLTTIFWGSLRSVGPQLYPLAARIPYLAGLLARTGMLERISLTPEGVAQSEAIRAIDAAIAIKLPVLVFSFHSPSLEPGNTPYIRTEADIQQFYSWWKSVFAHLEKRKILPTSVAELLVSLA